MVRIDLSARRICRLDVVDFVFPDDDASDLARETDTAVGESAVAADAAAAMSDTPLMYFRSNKNGEIVTMFLSFQMQGTTYVWALGGTRKNYNYVLGNMPACWVLAA